MRRSTSVLLAIGALVLIAALVFCVVYRRHSLKKGETQPETVEVTQESSESEIIDESEIVDSPITDEVQAAEIETPEAEAETFVEASVDGDTTTVTMTTANIDEVAYEEDITKDDTQALIDWLEAQPNIDAQMVTSFIAEYPEVFAGYQQDADGNFLVPLSDESLRSKDEERVTATVKLGLNKNQIDDALAMPLTLTPEQVKKIVDAKSGVKIDFTEDELKAWRTELWRSWLENPILFEAWVNLLLDQKVGDKTVKDYWTTGRKFSERYDSAREEGTGMNIWLRQNAKTGQHYTTAEYQQYVVAFIGLFEDKEMTAMALTAGPKDHYGLLWGEADLNSLRKANPADYEDPYAALWFNFHLKNGKIGIRIGANFRDKRPETINYQATTKPVAKKTGSTKKASTSNKTQSTSTPSNPTPSNPTPPEPTPQPTPEPTPQPTPKPEQKSPADDPAAQGNADVGGGKNDDSGPGTWKPDQGNGNGTYIPGTSENPDGSNPSSYDPGPAADNTDGGTPPPTTPIVDEGKGNDSYGGGTATGGNNSGQIAEPPVD